MCKYSLLCILLLNLNQLFSQTIPYSNSSTKFNLNGISVSITTYLRFTECTFADLKGVRGTSLNGDRFMIRPSDLENPFYSESIDFAVILSSISIDENSKSKKDIFDKYNLLIQSKDANNLTLKNNEKTFILSKDDDTGSPKPVFIQFSIKSNGIGEISINYKLVEKRLNPNEPFSVVKNGTIKIPYEVSGFFDKEEKEWEECKRIGLTCWCNYVAQKKKFSSEAEELIRSAQQKDWEGAQYSNSIDAYYAYKEKYSNCSCIYCDDADLKIETIKNSRTPRLEVAQPTEYKDNNEKKSGMVVKPPSNLDDSRNIRKSQENPSTDDLSTKPIEYTTRPADGEGWYTLTFRNISKPAYSPSPGLEVDDSRFTKELTLRVKFSEGYNYRIIVSDLDYPNKEKLEISLSNMLIWEMESDSLKIRLSIDKGSYPYRLELAERKTGKLVWERSNITPGEVTIYKSREFSNLNGEYELKIYEEGKFQPLVLPDLIILENPTKIPWKHIVIIALSITLTGLLLYIIRYNFRKRQSPWLIDQNEQ